MESKFKKSYKVEGLDEKNREIVDKEKNRKKMEEIIEIIEKKPELLENLNVPKLEIIDNYYKEKISECKRKLAKLSN